MQRIRPCPLEGMANQVQLKSKSRKRKRCGHCNEDLSLPVYKRHKNLYYNSQAKTWRQESSGESEGDDDESLFLHLDSSVDGSCSPVDFTGIFKIDWWINLCLWSFYIM